MKSCPACNRTYSDDSTTFCLVDGAVLSAPYDPNATQPGPTVRVTTPPATEILLDRDVPSTIRAPIPANPAFSHPAPQWAPSPPRKSDVFRALIRRVLLGIIIGAPVGSIIMLIINMNFARRSEQPGMLLAGAFFGAILGAILLPIIKYAWG